MTAIATLAAAFKSLWPRFPARDALAGLGPNLCKEAGVMPQGDAWMR